MYPILCQVVRKSSSVPPTAKSVAELSISAQAIFIYPFKVFNLVGIRVMFWRADSAIGLNQNIIWGSGYVVVTGGWGYWCGLYNFCVKI